MLFENTLFEKMKIQATEQVKIFAKHPLKDLNPECINNSYTEQKSDKRLEKALHQERDTDVK